MWHSSLDIEDDLRRLDADPRPTAGVSSVGVKAEAAITWKILRLDCKGYDSKVSSCTRAPVRHGGKNIP